MPECSEPLVPEDSAPFMPPDSWLMAPDEPPRSDDGELCWVAAPPAAPPPSRFMPCALAKPVPAIRAAAATEIKKRLVIGNSPHVYALPAQQRREIGDVPPYLRFHGLCFLNAR